MVNDLSTIYEERKEMEELIAHGIGKKEYLFSQDIYIRKEKQDIYFIIDVNLQEYHIHYDEPKDGKYRKTCIQLIDAADLWWIKDSNLTLLFFGRQSFEKGILKMLLFMGLGIDLFLERKLKMIEAERLKLGYEIEECDEIRIYNIQCILYDIADIDANYKELFSVLNDNPYKDRICFRYLEDMVLNDERLLELQGE